MPAIADTLSLPCGAVLPNRLAKGAMTEGLADPQGRATAELARLYGLWADGGAGLLITGNVQIDADHLERPGNVIIDRRPDAEGLAGLRAMAAAGTAAAASAAGRNGGRRRGELRRAQQRHGRPARQGQLAGGRLLLVLRRAQVGGRKVLQQLRPELKKAPRSHSPRAGSATVRMAHSIHNFLFSSPRMTHACTPRPLIAYA